MQELLVAEKGALEVHCTTADSALQHSQQQLSELTQKHAAIQAELTESLDYQQQIEAQLNELEMEAQAAKAGYEAEQAQSQMLSSQLSETQADLARVVNELTHTKTALDQTSELNKELQVRRAVHQTPWFTCNTADCCMWLMLVAEAVVSVEEVPHLEGWQEIACNQCCM